MSSTPVTALCCVGEQDLTGPLRDLVTTIVAAGGPHSGAAGLRAGGAQNAP